MQLKKLYFKDDSTGWCLQEAEFSPLSLLVGVSGVGKTKILRAIKTIAKLLDGDSFNGIEWKIVLHEDKIGEIIWAGKTEYTKEYYDLLQMPLKAVHQDKNNEFIFINEELKVNNQTIFKRENGDTIYRGNKTVKLQKTKSLFYLLQEDEILNIKKSTLVVSGSNHNFFPFNDKFIENNDKFETLESLLNENKLSLTEKLFILEKNYKDNFNKIKDEFISIFPFVEDLQFRNPQVLQDASINPAPEMQVLQFKERNSDTWISSWDFSSGMHKTLALISRMFLSQKGSLILIDEFENSFGLNCIDSISKLLFKFAKDRQIILTSHHPYIIKSIPTEYWKLVTRKNCDVSIKPVKDMLSTISKHDKFMQLINLDEYIEGIES